LLDPGDFHFRFPSFLSPTVDFSGPSLRSLSLFLYKVGLDNIRIVNCTFLPSAKIDVKKCLYPGRKMTARHAYVLMLVQLISTAVDDTTLVLYSV